MTLPARSETMTGSSEMTKVAETRRNSIERKPNKSPLSSDISVKVSPPTSPTSAAAVASSASSSSKEISIEEALRAPHLYPHKLVLKALLTDEEAGLHDHDVKARRIEYGSNELESAGTASLTTIIIRQVANAMTFCLILAMAVSFGIQTWIEAGVLAGIIILNVSIGTWQEYSAEQTMDSLRNLASPTARVIRGGSATTISANEVTIGDLLELNVGSAVPADVRLIETRDFETDEALLTGESQPIMKNASLSYGKEGEEVEISVGDRLNLAYSSSNVTKGRALGVVVAIGMHTEVGKVAEALRGAGKGRKIREVKRNAHGKAGPHRYAQAGVLTAWDHLAKFLGLTRGTPLQRQLSLLAVLLLACAILFTIIVFLANLGADVSPWGSPEVAIYGVATGVSIIPASLTAVLIICLSTGSRAMAKRNVVVRKLESLEALGSITDICSDKTGTLTQGRMVLRRAWVPGSGSYEVEETSEAFNPTIGKVERVNEEKREVVTTENQGIDKISSDERFMPFLTVASLCNLAIVYYDEEKKEWTAHGDPTECAIQTFACRFGYSRQKLAKKSDSQTLPLWSQICEMPFSSDLKRMAVVFKNNEEDDGKTHGFMKGAVEKVLDCCTELKTDDGTEKKSEKRVEEILTQMEEIASQGLRVLALARRELTAEEIAQGDDIERADLESKMTFLGLVGLYDPPRPESAGAVQLCRNAGIAVHMLTGDHLATASAIARQIGIVPKDDGMLSKRTAECLVMSASHFDKLSDEEIDAMPTLPAVIARCTPQTKVSMIQAIHRRNRLTAMTGDGVNDAPALKMGDIGIAMGQAGSDVAKDASDLTLSDDNFASITNAISEGRRLADNIQAFVLHLLVQNVCQACVLLIGLAFKDETGLSVFPLSSIEVLWVIIVTSSAPAMSLGMQKARANTMSRPPANLKRGIFTNLFFLDLAVYGIIMAILCLGTFLVCQFGFGDANFGLDCNAEYSEACRTVFQSRAATFCVMVNLSLLLAWQLVDAEASFFNGVKQGHWYSRWFYGSWGRNKSLFIVITLGIALEFPLVFIPGLNDIVFLHTDMTWHWGVVVVATLLFFASAEGYKWIKRIFLRRRAAKNYTPDEVSEQIEKTQPVEGTPIEKPTQA